MTITDLLTEECVIPELQSTTKEGVLAELAELLQAAVPSSDPGTLLAVLREREKLNSTAIGDGIAIPHGRLPGLSQVKAGFALSKAGVDFDSIDCQPTHIFFALVAPENAATLHLKALARIARILKDPQFRADLLSLEGPHEIFAAIVEKDGNL
ncbi:MAG: PTS sugar transporter subunit IIA [Deltaproteobacteria bacterium]